MADEIEIQPVLHPIVAVLNPPGSKSLTNRALIVAALADGTSRLTGVLDSRDSQVMIDSLRRLGIAVEEGERPDTLIVGGRRGNIPATAAELWLENSGTSIRFLTALCTVGSGRYRLDGNERMRERPIGELVSALSQLGARADCELGNDCPPVVVQGHGLPGGQARLGGTISSQYLSALLMAAPAARGPIELEVAGTQVSEPYVTMTLRVMEAFGVRVACEEGRRFRIEPQTYRAREYTIEPDASAASYLFGAAAITRGVVSVELTRESLQGDIAFVDVLEQMGCTIRPGAKSIAVEGGPLRGVDVDMNAISDTAQTLAAIAPFAEGPTRIRNIAHVRHKETDRIAALATELRRIGQQVEEHPDGLTIHPAPIRPAVIETYDDHRMAMSFALVGLRAAGIRISNPGCVGKTYPGFFEDLQAISRPGGSN